MWFAILVGVFGSTPVFRVFADIKILAVALIGALLSYIMDITTYITQLKQRKSKSINLFFPNI